MNIIIRKITLIIIFVVFSTLLLCAQQKNSFSQQKNVQTATKPIASNMDDEEEIDPSDVQAVIMEVLDRLKKEKESDPVPVTLTMSYAKSFADLSKYPKIEPVTKVSIVWYKSVSESLSKLAEIKLVIEVATFNKEEKKLQELKKNYKESVTRLIYLLEHPQKISAKR